MSPTAHPIRTAQPTRPALPAQTVHKPPPVWRLGRASVGATFIASLVITIAGLATATPSRAESYTFSQGGFAGGATVTGSFSGVDTDADGWLFGFELTAFSLSFSGNYAVPAFTHGLENLNGIGYRIGASQIGGGEFDHLASSNDQDSNITLYDAFGWPGHDIPGRVTDDVNHVASMSFDLIQVQAVPEPRTWALMGAGLLAVGLMRRRIGAADQAAPARP